MLVLRTLCISLWELVLMGHIQRQSLGGQVMYYLSLMTDDTLISVRVQIGPRFFDSDFQGSEGARYAKLLSAQSLEPLDRNSFLMSQGWIRAVC